MIRPPKPENESARLAVIERYGLAGQSSVPAYDRVATLAARMFDVPVALVSVVQEKIQCFVGARGFSETSTPRDHAFCAFAILKDDVMVVPDATKDPRFVGNPLVTGFPDIRFYAGAPIVVAGQPVGTLCLIDTKPREFSEENAALLKALAGMVVDLVNARLDRKIAEDADQRLTEIVNAMPTALAVWSETNRLIGYNDAFNATFFPGSARNSQIGVRMAEFIEQLEQGDLKAVLNGAGEAWRGQVAAETPEEAEPHEIRFADGRWVSTRQVKVSTGEVVSVNTDVTEARQREEELAYRAKLLRSTLDNIEHGIALFNRERRLVISNENFFRLLRTSKDEHPENSPLAGLLQVLARTGKCVGCDAAFYRAGGVERLSVGECREAQCITDDGQYLDFRATGAEDDSVVITATDITHRKKVERSKNEFVSTVNHELRTPLTSISGALGILTSGVAGQVPPEAGKCIDIAAKNCERLISLVNDLLEVDRIESGQLDLDLARLDLRGLMARAVEQNIHYAQSHGIELSLAGGDAPVAVRGDAERLLQVAANLISNAVKHSPAGAAVSIGISRHDGFGRFSVIDRGTGIPEEFRDQVFERFSQADMSDQRKVQGTGLGLSISRGLVEQHGGRIDFETEIGRGTRFHVDIPLVADDA